MPVRGSTYREGQDIRSLMTPALYGGGCEHLTRVGGAYIALIS